MSKYIIEIAEEYEEYFKGVLICGIADGKFAVDVIAREDLEELNSDYINENYGSLQDEAYQKGYDAGIIASSFVDKSDEAYQKGFEDGKKSIDKGCEGRKYEDNAGEHLPCEYCMNNFKNQWTAKQKDRIEVGDEVIDKDGDTTIVTNIHERLFDGLCGDGSTMSDLFMEDVRKTGRHYDHIGKLLEAIRA